MQRSEPSFIAHRQPRLPWFTVIAIALTMTACNLRPTASGADLLPTRTLAPRSAATFTPESGVATVTVQSVATANPNIQTPAVTPLPGATPAGLTSVISPRNAAKVDAVWSVSDAFMTYIYAVTSDRLAVHSSQGYKLIDSATLKTVKSTRLDAAIRSGAPYYWGISMNARYAVHYYDDGLVNIYDLTLGTVVSTLKATAVISSPIADVALDPAGREVTIANQTVQRYDIVTGAPIGQKWPMPRDAREVIVLRDGAYAAAFVGDDIVQINAISGKGVKLTAPFGANRALYVRSAPDNSLMAAGDSTGRVVLWDPLIGTAKYSLNFGSEVDVAVSPKGERIAASSIDGVTVMHLSDQKVEAQFRLKGAARPFSLQFSPDGKVLYVTSVSALESYSIPDGNPIDYVNTLPIKDVGFTADGHYVASWLAGASPELAVLDASTGDVAAAFTHPSPINRVVIGSVGDYFGVGTSFGGVYVWSLKDDKPLIQLPSSSGKVRSVLGFSNKDSEFAYLEPSGMVIQSLVTTTKRTIPISLTVLASGYSSRSGLVAIADDASARLMDLTGHVITTLENASGFERGALLAFSPDEHYLLGQFAQELRVWQTDTGKLTQHITLKNALRFGAPFTPDSASVVVRYGDTADLVNIRTGDVTPIRGPELHAFSIEFSPDGQVAAIGTYIDRSLSTGPNYNLGEFSIWKAGDTAPINGYDQLQPIYGLAFSPDGSRIVTASSLGELVMWGLPAQ